MVVTVTNQTKRLANGVTARVVHDVVTEGSKPVEVTDDYYAQDRRGNIWYLGEFTKEYENGKVKSTEGSFEAGVDGAQPGIALPAKPRPGLRYRQEYYKGHAEDKGKVVSVKEQAEVPFGHFKRVLMTRDTNPLEPRNVEFKFYARGVGPVLRRERLRRQRSRGAGALHQGQVAPLARDEHDVPRWNPPGPHAS